MLNTLDPAVLDDLACRVVEKLKGRVDDPVLLDLRGAGRVMNIGPRTVSDLIKDGKLKAVRVGVRVLVPLAEIRDFSVREAK